MRVIIRWVCVLPGAVLAALLAHFPIHWGILVVRLFWHVAPPEDIGPFIGPHLLSNGTLETFAVAFSNPFILGSVGAWIAPKCKVTVAYILISAYLVLITAAGASEWLGHHIARVDAGMLIIELALCSLGGWMGIGRAKVLGSAPMPPA